MEIVGDFSLIIPYGVRGMKMEIVAEWDGVLTSGIKIQGPDAAE